MTEINSADELWEVIRFRLLALGKDGLIKEEIERMVRAWQIHIDPSGMSAEEFRSKLYTLVREGMIADSEAYFERRKH
jgi:hypothetical protein